MPSMLLRVESSDLRHVPSFKAKLTAQMRETIRILGPALLQQHTQLP